MIEPSPFAAASSAGTLATAPAKFAMNGPWVVAGGGEAGLERRQRRAAARQRQAEHGGRRGKRLGEDAVMRRRLADRGGDQPRLLRRQALDHFLGRTLIRFREQHVEGDRGRPRLAQLAGQLGQHGARPGPLADRLQRRLVDVNDEDRMLRLRRHRRHALVKVESKEPDGLDGKRIGDAQQRSAGQKGRDSQVIDGPA
ncbi:MAG: hypothetical protein P0Y66_11195 [Candidatus Kaistia colombiensis]|nr:MAG: hypothetical protein P0Y66_11195 [Kaistia sp.]